MTSPLPLISTLISDSEKLIKLAESADWEAFSALEITRQAKLKTLDLRNVNLTEQAHNQVQTKMKHLIELNAQLTTICEQQRGETMNEITKLTAGNKAKKAYS